MKKKKTKLLILGNAVHGQVNKIDTANAIVIDTILNPFEIRADETFHTELPKENINPKPWKQKHKNSYKSKRRR